MGLRELNAARTRALIADAAYALFAEQGYEDTTMEQVADRADVGSSTLYRYFPTKESLALAPLGEPGVMAAEVARRPVGEPVDEVLGHAVLALVADSDEAAAETMRQVVEANPRLNAACSTGSAGSTSSWSPLSRSARAGGPTTPRSGPPHGWRSSCSNEPASCGSRAAGWAPRRPPAG